MPKISLQPGSSLLLQLLLSLLLLLLLAVDIAALAQAKKLLHCLVLLFLWQVFFYFESLGIFVEVFEIFAYVSVKWVVVTFSLVALKKLALFSFPSWLVILATQPSYWVSFLFLVVLGGLVGWASFCQSRNHLFFFTSSWLTSNPPPQAAAPYPPSNILPGHLFLLL